LFDKDPEKVSYPMLEQLRDSIGPYGEERITYLKEQFLNIITNVVPFETK